MEIGIKFMELYTTRIQNLVSKFLLPYYFQALKKASPTDNEVLYSICLFDTYLDLAGQDQFI